MLDEVVGNICAALTRDARTHLAAAAQAQGHGGRGLHSSTSHLNLSRSRHCNPETTQYSQVLTVSQKCGRVEDRGLHSSSSHLNLVPFWSLITAEAT